MEQFWFIIDNISAFIWGGSWNGERILPLAPLAVILLGTGAWFMIATGFRPIRRFFPALGEAWAGRKAQGEEGSITPWQALSTALSGQVGTGNLAGVATAITLGGPGAIFWMWITAIFGMACAFAESSLAVKYRETHEGTLRGGPMYYIKNGLNNGKGGFAGKFGWLAIFFCLGTVFSALITGGMVQSNSVTQTVMESSRDIFGFEMPSWIIGAVIATMVFIVIIGGIKSIGSVAGKLVPLMAGLYVVVAFIVLVMNFQNIPAAFGMIFGHAFGLQSVFGGVAGYGMAAAVRYGIARGLFSNEAGQGSAPIAHSTAKTGGAHVQGEIAMVGVFIDTIIICTMTALVLLSVEGDYKRSPALVAAEVCKSKELVVFDDFAKGRGVEGVTFEDTFPSASVPNRSELIANNSELATAYLNGCRTQGLSVAATLPDQTAEAEEAYFQFALEAAKDPEALQKVKYVWQTDAESAAVTARAYSEAINIGGLPLGGLFITVALFLFAFTTMLGWSYYAETAVTYIFGEKAVFPLKIFWVAVIFAGAAVTQVKSLWRLGDLANASMALPNLLAILLLSGAVIGIHKASKK